MAYGRDGISNFKIEIFTWNSVSWAGLHMLFLFWCFWSMMKFMSFHNKILEKVDLFYKSEHSYQWLLSSKNLPKLRLVYEVWKIWGYQPPIRDWECSHTSIFYKNILLWYLNFLTVTGPLHMRGMGQFASSTISPWFFFILWIFVIQGETS